jgi:hypothetical protein
MKTIISTVTLSVMGALLSGNAGIACSLLAFAIVIAYGIRKKKNDNF